MPAEIPTTQARRRGKAARDEGMEQSAQRKRWFIRWDTLRFLDAITGRADHTASLDDVPNDQGGPFADGGKWRGSIPKALAREGLIEQAGVGCSDRPSRHRGYVGLWRAKDLAGIEAKQDELRRWLADHPCPTEPVGETLFDDLVGERTVEHAL